MKEENVITISLGYKNYSVPPKHERLRKLELPFKAQLSCIFRGGPRGTNLKIGEGGGMT